MYQPIGENIDLLYDGSLKLVNFLLRVIDESEKFTKNDYPSKEEFYEMFINRYYEFQDEVYNNMDFDDENHLKLEIIIQAMENVLLKVLKVNSELTLFIFLKFYCQILAILSYIKDIDYEMSVFANHGYIFDTDKKRVDLFFYNLDNIDNVKNIEEEMLHILKNIDKHKEDYQPILIPFISRSGAYGLNTYLIMYMNGLGPVGITSTPSEHIHGGAFSDSLLQPIDHDLSHNRVNLTSRGVYQRLGQLDARKIKTREYYEEILKIEDEDLRKDCIYVLFDNIHEYDSDPECNSDTFKNPHKIPNYNPEFFFDHRFNDTDSEDEAFVVQYVWRSMVKNYCKYVRHIKVDRSRYPITQKYLDRFEYE